ncbi:DUF5702 domain-containing protein [Hominifimenecus sp. rT4P-3]|uniref:DUF5702 domain-containing protein n=1 Tax=Hominifimenecus sp. rT4P-3 TaxID=3242979 RepID=UPI003DA2045E
MKRSGQITVFLCLILIVILSLFCACLESARGAGLQYRLRLIADSSLQSVFAGYDRILWEKYQLLFCPAGDRAGSRIREEMLRFAQNAVEDPAGPSGLDWTAPEVKDIQISDLIFATDQNGAVFEKAVLDYMKAGAVPILYGELQKILGDGDEFVSTAVRESEIKGKFSFEEVEQKYDTWKKEVNKQIKEVGQPETNGETAIPQENVVDAVKQLISSGVLPLVVENPEQISKETVEWSLRPSQLEGKAEGRSRRDDSDGGRASNLTDILLFDEYLLRFFDCYTSRQEKEDFTCQLEYVIAGRESDWENLSEVIDRLLWIREALNLSYLISDPASREAAAAAATALAGWTGIPFLITGLRGLILAAWAYGEALADLQTLLAGGNVPLRKDKTSWRTSLHGLVQWEEHGGRQEEEKGEGLSYEDYLRLLLFSIRQEEKCYRAMDVIQFSMENLSPGFRLDCCAISCKASLLSETGYRFWTFPVFASMGHWGGFYALEAETEFHY